MLWWLTLLWLALPILAITLITVLSKLLQQAHRNVLKKVF